ncbi:MAG: NTP transferase domain-containing protein, partial [Pseudomonadota bacterium]
MNPPGGAFVALLAAGQGERFGGGKLLAPLAGRPLILHALETALASGLGRVLVVLGRDADELRAVLPADPRLEVLVNPRWPRGMGTSLALAAARAQQGGAGVLAVLLGDMPLVSPA